jgi:hypothetical protein
MAIYIQKASILKKGIPFIFDVTTVYYNVVYGHFFDLEKIPSLFEASHLIDGTGKLSLIYENDLRWFHYETHDKMLLFDHFRLPRYVKNGDKLLYLE